MRVTLIQPPQGSRFGFSKILLVEPLGLECVAAALKLHDHEVNILDLRLDKTTSVYSELRSIQPGAVGISCSFTSDVYTALNTAKMVRDALPKATIFIGGHHASLIPGHFLFPGSPVDAVVIGEGELTGLALADALERNDDPAEVPGVMTLSNWDNGFQTAQAPRNFDDLPLPDRQLTRRYRRHYHHGFAVPSACVETSRGCPFDCNFCSIWVFYQRRTRRRSPKRIVDDLIQAKTLGEDHVFFTDDIAFLQYDEYRELANCILDAGLNMHFSCETRPDLVVKYRDLFPLWKEAGMNTIFLGVEKVDDAGLDSIRKRTKGGSDTNVKAIEILRSCGITPITTFLTDPSWGEQDFDRVEEFITRLKLPNPSFTILTPLPGTELWEDMKSDVITDDYSRFDILHLVLPSKLEPQRFYQRFARLCSLTDVRTHFSWQAVWTLIKLGLRGHGHVVLQVFRAMRELCNPRAYLGSPGKERKPDFIPDDFAAIPRLDKGMSHLVDRVLDTRTNEDKLEAKSQKRPEPESEVSVS